MAKLVKAPSDRPAVKVPVSFDRPTPASRAKAKAQETLETSRRSALALLGTPATSELLARAQRQLGPALRRAETPADVSRAVNAALVAMRPRMVAMLDANARKTARAGAEQSAKMLGLFEGEKVPVLSKPNDKATLAGLSFRHSAAVARYEAATRAMLRSRVEEGLANGKRLDEVARELSAPGDGLMRTRAWADRIVRTEGMSALNSAALDEMMAQRDEAFFDLKKKLIETFDERTGDDSYPAHGQVRELEGLFVDGAGREYLRPPGRPNDRGVCIPWRSAWKRPDDEQRRTPHDELAASGGRSRGAAADGGSTAAATAAQSASGESEGSAVHRSVPYQVYDTFIREQYSNTYYLDEGTTLVRDTNRALLDAHGMKSADLNVGGVPGARKTHAGGYFLGTEADDLRGAAYHNDVSGEIMFDPVMHGHARDGLGKLAAVATKQERGKVLREMTRSEVNGVVMLVHEEVHGYSPAGLGAAKGNGIKLEEALTEATARTVVKRFGGIPYDDRTPGLALPTFDEKAGRYKGVFFTEYDNYIDDLYEATRRVMKVAPVEVQRRLEDAMFSLRSSIRAPVEDPRDYFRLLGTHLGLTEVDGAKIANSFLALQADRKSAS